ncbi:MAG: tetratricopeptide repeat protein [Pseudomonadota bacterium]
MVVRLSGARRRIPGIGVMLGCAIVVIAGLAVSPGVHAGYGDALSWYGEQAEAGDAEAQYLLAFALEHGVHDEIDLEAARAWYGTAAAQGHPRAAYRLALMQLEGRGGAVDMAGAEASLTPAADAGDTAAQSLLGYLLARDGDGRHAEAYQWLSLAADRGDAFAATNLASLMNSMSAEDIADGEALVAAWRDTHQP